MRLHKSLLEIKLGNVYDVLSTWEGLGRAPLLELTWGLTVRASDNLNPNKENHFNPTFAGLLLKIIAALYFLAPSSFLQQALIIYETSLQQKGYN